MSTTYVQYPAGGGCVFNGTASVPWVRPAGWEAMPAISPSEEKICILVHVYENDANPIAFYVTGNYTVDWGDGTSTENFASSATAGHNYDWSSLSALTELPSGARQSIITITPQGGASLTGFFWQTLLAPYNVTAYYQHPAVEMKISMPNGVGTSPPSRNTNTFTTGNLQRVEYVNVGSFTGFQICAYNQNLKEVVFPADWVPTSLYQAFYQSGITDWPFTGIDLDSVATAYQCFNGCANLRSVPDFSMLAATTVEAMFANCDTLTTVGNVTFGSLTSSGARNVFSGCYGLRTVGIVDLGGSSTYPSSMFQSCHALVSVEALVNWHNVLYMDGLFSNCYSLQYAPPCDIDIANSFSIKIGNAWFNGCRNLREIPDWNWEGMLATPSLFSYCRALEEVVFNCSTLTSMAQCFQYCSNLRKVSGTAFNSNITSYASTFLSCYSLQEVPDPFPTDACTNMSQAFQNATNISVLNFTSLALCSNFSNWLSVSALKVLSCTAGPAVSHSIAEHMVDDAMLDAWYTALPAAVATITVTDCIGTGTDTPSIATGKGWTVTG